MVVNGRLALAAMDAGFTHATSVPGFVGLPVRTSTAGTRPKLASAGGSSRKVE